ncbi:helix-turn-helix domain-containing protein [Micromonospora sp. NPDC049523]|uniref:AraC family transcriptional regulator n=1 Tax=Micromonospora sp. NPDC049523 TaxID=3155921 RepID=UPI00343A7BF7
MKRDELVSPEVARALRPWFSGITLGAQAVVHDAPAVLEQPDHATTLTWRAGSADPYEVVIMGPRTRARYYVDRPGRDCLQLRFRPGRAAEVLGFPLRDLADRAVAVADAESESMRTLVRLIADGHVSSAPDSPETRLRSLARALPMALAAQGDRDGLRSRVVAEATARLSGGDGSPREPVSLVARRLNISERHLRTVFVDGVGLTPSQFVRIDRVRLVLARIGQKLPELATDAGYYDQSHMGANFRGVMGATPHAFAVRRWPAVEACSAEAA